MKIASIKRNNTPTTVYDFTVEGAHHYFLGNGVVVHNSYFPASAMSGGQGLVYVSDSIAMLTRSKEKDKDKNVIGSIVHVKMYKSRLSRENTSVDVRISYEGGLDRYYGILDMAVDAGMVENAAGRYTFPGQKAATAAKIAEAPETYFTKEFLETLDEAFVRPNFSYGRGVLGTSITEAE
jgi:hypothetical protein